MPWWLAIPFTLFLATVVLALSFAIGFNLMFFLPLGSAFWVARDDDKLVRRGYDTRIPCRPGILILGVLLLWIFVFPWYLLVRHRTKTLKPEARNALRRSASQETAAPGGRRAGPQVSPVTVGRPSTTEGGDVALVDCPGCGRQVSLETERCPHCRYRLQRLTHSEDRPGDCSKCGGRLLRSSEARSRGLGILVFVVGIMLAPALIGFPILMYGIHLMGERETYWRCKVCQAKFQRKAKWYERR